MCPYIPRRAPRSPLSRTARRPLGFLPDVESYAIIPRRPLIAGRLVESNGARREVAVELLHPVEVAEVVGDGVLLERRAEPARLPPQELRDIRLVAHQVLER